MMTDLGLSGWTPVAVSERGIDWCFTQGIGFDDPFFDQTVERSLRSPFRSLFLRSTPLETLARVAGQVDAIPPSGFVFHMSRCGSTLAGQMLSATGSTLVVSEAAPLAQILETRPGDDEGVRLVRGMVAALGQRRSPSQRHLVVKLDAWAVFRLPLLRRAFPDVPWVFLFRDPEAVLASQMRQRGSHLIPGVLPEAVTGIRLERAVAMPPEEFCARLLARLCEAAVASADPMGRFVDYRAMPAAVPDLIAPWFGIAPSAGDRATMMERAARDAKTPGLSFERESRPAIEDAVRRAAATHLGPVHVRLAGLEGRAA